MEQFTPISAMIGGVLLGLAAAGFFYLNRQICGISGMVEGTLPPFSPDVKWKAIFLAGMICGGILLLFIYPHAFEFTIQSSLPVVVFAGFLVGFGSRLGKGCTSGHGICGVGRLAPRSIYATVVFLLAGIITATIMGAI